MALKDEIQNPYIQAYLDYVEETESPRIFHIWCAVGALSGCLERHASFPFGIGPIYPNMYIALVGPPATRKSTAIYIAARLLRSSTGIRFAPDDTSGQRQGLISAMQGEEDEIDGQALNGHTADIQAAIDEVDLEAIGNIRVKSGIEDRHVMFAACNELTSLLGENSRQMLTFLQNVYDGVDYNYKLRKDNMKLKDPLLSILGATTPTDIVEAMPGAAIGKGFMSRTIFAFAPEKYKHIHKPQPLDEEKAKQFKALYSSLYYEFTGEFRMTEEADDLLKELYDGYQAKINDTRFIYYEERRHIHLIKVSMLLAASRMDLQITKEDLQDAHRILAYTEKYMPDALGEFGMSPVAAAKHKMLEYLQHCRVPIPEAVLWSFMHRDMRQMDFANSLMDLCNSGKIVKMTDPATKSTAYVYKDKQEDMNKMLEGLFDA